MSVEQTKVVIAVSREKIRVEKQEQTEAYDTQVTFRIPEPPEVCRYFKLHLKSQILHKFMDSFSSIQNPKMNCNKQCTSSHKEHPNTDQENSPYQIQLPQHLKLPHDLTEQQMMS